MTAQVTRRKRSETTEQRYRRLNKRIARRLPVTAAETAFVWRLKSTEIGRRSDPLIDALNRNDRVRTASWPGGDAGEPL